MLHSFLTHTEGVVCAGSLSHRSSLVRMTHVVRCLQSSFHRSRCGDNSRAVTSLYSNTRSHSDLCEDWNFTVIRASNVHSTHPRAQTPCMTLQELQTNRSLFNKDNVATHQNKYSDAKKCNRETNQSENCQELKRIVLIVGICLCAAGLIGGKQLRGI